MKSQRRISATHGRVLDMVWAERKKLRVEVDGLEALLARAHSIIEISAPHCTTILNEIDSALGRTEGNESSDEANDHG